MIDIDVTGINQEEKELLGDLINEFGVKSVLEAGKEIWRKNNSGGTYSQEEVNETLSCVRAEVIRARGLHPVFNSAHEAYGVILEELDESWDEIKRNDIPRAREEMLQVAAMAVRFLLDIKG